MSSRVLKKLHGDNQEIDDDISSDIETDTGRKSKFNLNRYDLLHQNSPSESEFKEDDNETEPASHGVNNSSEQSKKKKKKRKKKNVKSSTNNQRRSSEDYSTIDDLARTVKEVDKICGEINDQTPLPAKLIDTSSKLLSVQHKNLNPSNEMKRLFGSRVVQSENNKRRNVRSQRRSTWLVNAKENWPPVGKTGIEMNLVSPQQQNTSKTISDKNIVYFAIEHSLSYRQLQQKFLTAVESMDSDNIIQIINHQPYHVDSLIQLSELCKMSEDHAMAAELIEHSILSLESSFHPMFSLTTGNCRLDYKRQENRALYVVLFKHAQYLENRACSRTALEIAKLILTLEPENDPLAMILIIDFFALRSKQYDWLVQLYNEWEKKNNLSQLPNMAYSYALALFYVSKNNIEVADKALQYALLMFPGVLRLLLDELAIQVDSRVSSHHYFSSTYYAKHPLALQQLIALYVCRAKLLWKDNEILPWLEKNVNIVMDRIDANDEIVADYTAKRNQRYIKPPKAILRHIVLSDFKEKVPLASFLNKDNDPILMYDPLPPTDSINIYSRPNMSSTSTRHLDGSPFSMFFQSLLPNFNMQQNRPALPAPRGGGEAGPNQQNDAPEGANDGVQTYTEFRNSLNSIVDAMRDFLLNVRPNDGDLADDNDDNSEDD